MTYTLTQNVTVHADCEIFTSKHGEGYYKNGELHIVNGKYHYVGKTDGWYLISMVSGKECFLGKGATPTFEPVELKITDATLFKAIATEETDE